MSQPLPQNVLDQLRDLSATAERLDATISVRRRDLIIVGIVVVVALIFSAINAAFAVQVKHQIAVGHKTGQSIQAAVRSTEATTRFIQSCTDSGQPPYGKGGKGRPPGKCFASSQKNQGKALLVIRQYEAQVAAAAAFCAASATSTTTFAQEVACVRRLAPPAGF